METTMMETTMPKPVETVVDATIIQETHIGDEAKLFKSRMYRSQLPDIGDKVIITYKEVRQDQGIIVTLNEYDDLQAIIYFHEFTRQKRIKSYTSLCHIGHLDVAEVIDINVNKKYISLSKKHLSEKDIKNELEHYELNRKLQTIIKKICIKLKIMLVDAYDSFIWDLVDWFEQNNDNDVDDDDGSNSIDNDNNNDSNNDNNDNNNNNNNNDNEVIDDDILSAFISKNIGVLEDCGYKHPYNLFSDKDQIVKLVGIDDISKKILDNITANHVDYFGKNIEKFCLEFSFKSFNFDGVSVIQEQLTKIKQLSETYPNIHSIDMLLNQSPMYKITVSTDNKSIIPDFIDKLKSLFIDISNNKSGVFQFIKSTNI
jgi:translation initiation factor 2 alpha subunit (eIF-2alpha)